MNVRRVVTGHDAQAKRSSSTMASSNQRRWR